jgi:hypothetical protein
MQFNPTGRLGPNADVTVVGETHQPPSVVDPAEQDPLTARQ